jgi:hypothetical protein
MKSCREVAWGEASYTCCRLKPGGRQIPNTSWSRISLARVCLLRGHKKEAVAQATGDATSLKARQVARLAVQILLEFSAQPNGELKGCCLLITF